MVDLYPWLKKHKRQPVKKTSKDVIWDKQKGKCYFCKKRLSPSYTHYDHIKLASCGGSSSIKNLRAVCANCHSRRHKQEGAKARRKRSLYPWQRLN